MATGVRALLMALLLWLPAPASADDTASYAVKNINPSLLKHANAVVREYTVQMEITGLQEVNIREHSVITILNNKGDEYANNVVASSSLEGIKSMSGSIYKGDGQRVKKIKQADFTEVPMVAGYSLLSDNKIASYKVNYRQYPYTVEYTIITQQHHTFYLPAFSPLDGQDCSLEHARLEVRTTGSTNLRYKAFATSATPQIAAGDEKTYTWDINNVPAQKEEPLSYQGNFATPVIMLALNDFSLGEFAGNMSSWSNFGQFIYELNKGRDVLPADVKEHIHKLTAGMADDHLKVAALYAYLQNTMRYVAVEYGIGGWQTLEAGFVARNNYGDCKALSNYMMAMLEAVNITAYPVVIKAGRENGYQLTKDFVCSQWNHELLCVPFAKDTMWLECTSNDLPAGYPGDFTQDRDALMITPSGGVVVHTPVYNATENRTVHRARIVCQPDKTLTITMANEYSGDEAERLQHYLTAGNDHDKEEFIAAAFHLANYKVNDYKFKKTDTLYHLRMTEHAVITGSGMMSTTGNKTFVSMDAVPFRTSITADDEDRVHPFYLARSYSLADTFELALPGNSKVAFIPPPVSVSYSFGSYYCNIEQAGDKVVMTRALTINGGVYDAQLFHDYAKLLHEAANGPHKMIVLKSIQ